MIYVPKFYPFSETQILLLYFFYLFIYLSIALMEWKRNPILAHTINLKQVHNYRNKTIKRTNSKRVKYNTRTYFTVQYANTRN